MAKSIKLSRLQTISRQLYGKDALSHNEKKIVVTKDHLTRAMDSISTTTSLKTDTSYLKQDLMKVLLFSLIAFVFQIIFYLALQNKLINLNF